MASSDEEDLEALRNAALASLRQKQVPQEPQGIQVLNLSARQTVNQYDQQVAEPVSNPEEDYVYGNYGEVPFAFQQAVLNRQTRGRGWRGRGWGRGNNFRFMPKPPPQSALIVIQVEGSETEQRKREERPKDSRPLLLRPQDKWASTEGSSQGSTPPRPKDTSKFSRYDDATDSEEEEDDHIEQSQPEYDSIHINMNMSLDDVSSDTEVELRTHDLGGASEAPDHNEMNSDTDAIESNGIENTDLGLTDSEIKDNHTEITDVEESVMDMSQNITIDEVHSDLNTSQTTEKSDTDVSNVENKVPDTLSGELQNSSATTTNVNEVEDMSHLNKNIDILVDRDIESDSTPLRDEQTTPVQDELKQEDSVSYSAFSRFNRRNRNESDSCDDSSEQLDSGSEVSNSKNSSRLRQSSGSESDNDSAASDIDANNTEADILGEVTQVISQSRQTHTAKIPQQSQLSQSPVPSKSSKKSSSSESDSESSSSSNSESSSVSSGGPTPMSSSNISSNSKRDVKTSMRKSESPVNMSTKSRLPIDSKRHVTSDMRERKHYKTEEFKNQRQANTGNRNVDYSRKETEREFKQLLRKVGRERSPHIPHKHSGKEISINEIYADPEFDATNYRDETMYQRNIKRDRPDKNRLAFSRKPDGENRRGESKSNFNTVENYNIGRSRSGDKKEILDEKRYFGEIGRLKGEDQHLKRDISKKEPMKSSKWKQSPNIPSEKSKSNRSESNTAGKKDDKKLSIKEISKKEKNLKSVKSNTCVTNKYVKNVKPGKSQNDVKDKDAKNVKPVKLQSDTKANDKYRDKSRRKSDEKLRRKSTPDKLRQNNSKEERQLKRKSIEERLKKIANLADESDSESDSDKSVSSVSDISSDSEAEMWRDKKQGATRKTADIELERRRREIKKREMNRNRETAISERGGDTVGNIRPKYRDSVMKVGKHDSDYYERNNYRKSNYKERRKLDEEDDMKQRYYHKKNMVFYEENTSLSKKFEELSSESDSNHRSHRGVISVVKADNKRQAEEIPSLFDISVTKPKLDKERNVRKKTSKKERLVIHVEQSSDEDISSTKSKKKIKKKRTWSSEEKMNEVPVQQVVNVTFNKEIEPKQSRQSVYDRLGMKKNKKTMSKVTESDDSGVKRVREVSLPASGKRIKLSGSGKDTVARKTKKSQKESKDDPDAALNLRIRKIQEKNAEILRRKHEVEQDKEKYG